MNDRESLASWAQWTQYIFSSRNVFSHPDDGCSVSCKLLRLCEQLAEDFEKYSDVEHQMQQMKTSEDSMETYGDPVRNRMR